MRLQDNAYSHQNLHSDGPTSVYELPSTNYIDGGIELRRDNNALGRRGSYMDRTLSETSRNYGNSQGSHPPSPHLSSFPPHTYVTPTTTSTYLRGPTSSNNTSERRASSPHPLIAPFTHSQPMSSSHGMIHSMSDRSSLPSEYTRLQTGSSSSFEQVPPPASTAPPPHRQFYQNRDLRDDQSTHGWRLPLDPPIHFVGPPRSSFSYQLLKN